MISRSDLLKALDHDLQMCDKIDHGSDTRGSEQKMREHQSLLAHQEWTIRAGDDQNELEKVVQSLEKNEIIRGYRHWREVATRRFGR